MFYNTPAWDISSVIMIAIGLAQIFWMIKTYKLIQKTSEY
jgi:hypothetical protein